MLGDPNLKNYLDTEAVKLIAELEVINEPIPKNITRADSLNEKARPPFVFNLRNTSVVITTGLDIKECLKGNCLGFTGNKAHAFDKFINTIYRDKPVNKSISFAFIKSTTFKWLVNSRRNSDQHQPFTQFLLDQFNDEIKVHDGYYFIDNLEIERPIQIGKCEIGSFTGEIIQKRIEVIRQSYPDKVTNYEQMLMEYKGKVFIKTRVLAEHGKALEVAFEECGLSMDVLKICSHTLDHPEWIIPFEINKRSIYDKRTEVLLESDPDTSRPSIVISSSWEGTPHMIKNADLPLYTKRGLEMYSNFINSLPPEPNELQKLILKGIRKFSRALYNTDKHQRIVDLFTIIESTLLINDEVSILDSLRKYLPKLVCTKTEDRTMLMEVLTQLYGVRSKFSHHAIEGDFEINDLKKLQRAIMLLFQELISRSEKGQTKEDILGDIDNRILEA